MELPHIVFSNIFTKKERHHQITHQHFLGFYVSGLLWQRSYDHAGNLLSENDHTKTPGISLSVSGTSCDFEYGDNRENWVIGFDMPALQYDTESKTMFLQSDDGHRIPVLRHIPVSTEEVSIMRERFRTITEYYRSTLPQHILEAQIMTMHLFRYFLNNHSVQPGNSPVEQFRARLDEDTAWNMTLDEHCRALGVGRDTMRQLFMAKYNISPGDYRTRKRLQFIRHLFINSELSLKEIAFTAGMKNVTHLNSLIRLHYNKTPSEMLRELRSIPIKD